MDDEKWGLPELERKSNNPEIAKSKKFEKLSTFDWLSMNKVWDVRQFNIFEVSFKDGSRKEFVRNPLNLQVNTGDWVAVDTGSGYDIGKISLSGDLVRLQMKKRKISGERELNTISRFANNWEVEKLSENKAIEYNTLVRSRAIAATLRLDMKIGDVEYQADKRKATFFYTSDERVDFRDLVKEFAKEFKVKVEMRQIGIRQESSKIGGIGSCGRELCCSTWHTNFTSVTTDMVKYQNLSVNQSKLTGLCGRLKCCLNYELDVYLEALEDFPKDSEVLELEFSKAFFVKLDIFKGLMYYNIRSDKDRTKIYALSKDRVLEIRELNKQGKKPTELGAVEFVNTESGENLDFEDVTGQIELKETFKNKRRNNKKPNKNRNKPENDNRNRPENQNSNLKNENQTEKRPVQGKKIEKPVKNDAPDKNVSGNEQNQTLSPGNQPKKNKKKFKRFPNKNKDNKPKDIQ